MNTITQTLKDRILSTQEGQSEMKDAA